ncbi:DNA repair protein RecN [Glycocaulis abyssi]|uniref:DNA repair protein RecN n=1 Tax=Glycocaulis abyssi TaxID=1433403 RepID=A0ABV9NCT3_9PROT
MLASLSIRDIVLIDRLDLVFRPGLSALTGETGAGKSILLGALGLACGERADRAMVRAGAEQGSAIAVFELPETHSAFALLEESGISFEPGEPVILRRAITADGRSRAHVNDQPASVGLLRSLGDVLVEIHGQHDGRGLLDPKSHKRLLDEFAGNGERLAAAARGWERVSAARRHLETLRTDRARAAEEEVFLRHAVEELDALHPRPGEEETLAGERRFLQQAESALSDLQLASEAFSGADAVASRLNHALKGLERVRASLGAEAAADSAQAHAVSALDRASGALERALIEFDEAETALTDAASAFEVESGALERAEERLFALRALARKHQVEVDKLPALRSEFADRLEAVADGEGREREAESALKAAEADYARAASALSEARKTQGEKLAAAVMAELAPLKLEKARFRVVVTSDETRAGPSGWDSVAFEVSTNPGAPFGPLDRIASGGELSRFALALKVCLAGSDSGIVMVFDEVDQGVGGAVADAVGHRLARLAEGGQALVVTHSPQVAARAGHHWKIAKAEEGETMRTRVVPLDGRERREEIARMLSGAEVTEAARAAADELMAI